MKPFITCLLFLIVICTAKCATDISAKGAYEETEIYTEEDLATGACSTSDYEPYAKLDYAVTQQALRENRRHIGLRFLAYLSYFRHKRSQIYPSKFYCTEQEIQKSIATLNPVSAVSNKFADAKRMYDIINKENHFITSIRELLKCKISPHPALSLCSLGVKCCEDKGKIIWRPFCCDMCAKFWYVAFTGERFLCDENDKEDPDIERKMKVSYLNGNFSSLLEQQRESTKLVKETFLYGIKSLSENVGVHFFTFSAYSLVHGHEQENGHTFLILRVGEHGETDKDATPGDDCYVVQSYGANNPDGSFAIHYPNSYLKPRSCKNDIIPKLHTLIGSTDLSDAQQSGAEQLVENKAQDVLDAAVCEVFQKYDVSNISEKWMNDVFEAQADGGGSYMARVFDGRRIGQAHRELFYSSAKLATENMFPFVTVYVYGSFEDNFLKLQELSNIVRLKENEAKGILILEKKKERLQMLKEKVEDNLVRISMDYY